MTTADHLFLALPPDVASAIADYDARVASGELLLDPAEDDPLTDLVSEHLPYSLR